MENPRKATDYKPVPPYLKGKVLIVNKCDLTVDVLQTSVPGDANSTKPVRAEDFVSLTDQFVGDGDLIATSRLTAMLTRMERPYRLRIGSDVSFHDLRTAPAILVGYSYTRWREIGSQLRFFIDVSRNPVTITDFGHPTQFSLPNLPSDRRTNENYVKSRESFIPTLMPC